MDDAEIRLRRAALQSEITMLSEALRRLTELEAEAQAHDGQLAGGGVAEPSDSAGSLLHTDDPVPMASDQDLDGLYPLDDPFDDEPEEEDAIKQLGYQEDDDDVWSPIHRAVATGRLYVSLNIGTSSELLYDSADSPHDTAAAASDDDFYPLDDASDESGTPMQWLEQLYRQVVHDTLAQQLQPDAIGHLRETEHDDDDNDISEDHITQAIVARRLHVPRIQGATYGRFGEAHGNGGFGGVPASAAAIAGLEKQRYDGSGADSSCVICIRSYRKGSRLRVMPCASRHRFHGRCLKKWLSRSHLCPLCRHALPTEDQAAVHSSAGAQSDRNS